MNYKEAKQDLFINQMISKNRALKSPFVYITDLSQLTDDLYSCNIFAKEGISYLEICNQLGLVHVTYINSTCNASEIVRRLETLSENEFLEACDSDNYEIVARHSKVKKLRQRPSKNETPQAHINRVLKNHYGIYIKDLVSNLLAHTDSARCLVNTSYKLDTFSTLRRAENVKKALTKHLDAENITIRETIHGYEILYNY